MAELCNLYRTSSDSYKVEPSERGKYISSHCGKIDKPKCFSCRGNHLMKDFMKPIRCFNCNGSRKNGNCSLLKLKENPHNYSSISCIIKSPHYM